MKHQKQKTTEATAPKPIAFNNNVKPNNIENNNSIIFCNNMTISAAKEMTIIALIKKLLIKNKQRQKKH